MDKVAGLKLTERSELFSETAARMGVSPNIIEKDFWVCWVLRQIFSEESLRHKLLFKGGTSLSKVYKVIERFSEDIDLILDWNLVCDEDPVSERSRTKQEKLNKEINESAQDYISRTLLPLLSNTLSQHCTVTVDSNDPNCLNVEYPKSFDYAYIRPEVRLEIGPLASWLPYGDFIITPYVSEFFPDIFDDANVGVRAIKAARTFWEKATILHHETNRPDVNTQPPRYSRHYYDFAMMAESDIKGEALSDLALLDEVIQFKKRFYNRGWANYDLAVPGTLRLIPGAEMQKNLEKDYVAMRDMIFGKEISFSEILAILKRLEDEINSIK